jgi:hypothetical protein
MRFFVLLACAALLVPLRAHADAAPAYTCDFGILPNGAVIPANTPALLAISSGYGTTPRLDFVLRGPSATDSQALTTFDFAVNHMTDVSTWSHGRVGAIALPALAERSQYDLDVTGTCANMPAQERHLFVSTGPTAPLPTRVGTVTAQRAGAGYDVQLMPDAALVPFLPVAILRWSVNGVTFEEQLGTTPTAAALRGSGDAFLHAACNQSDSNEAQHNAALRIDAHVMGSDDVLTTAETSLVVDCTLVPQVTPVSDEAYDDNACSAAPGRSAALSPLPLFALVAWLRRARRAPPRDVC